MDGTRACSACGASLAGPFDPGIELTTQPSPNEPDREDGAVTVRAWICPACGLAAWYVDDQELARLPEGEGTPELAANPDASYERRNQMMRMLRRVRRM